MTWLGHILRMQKTKGEERLVKVALRVQHNMGGQGDLFMDAPLQNSFEEIEEVAQDRAKWRRLVDARFGKKPKSNRTRTKKHARSATTPPVETPLLRWREITNAQAKRPPRTLLLQPRVLKRPLLSEINIPSGNHARKTIQSELPTAWTRGPTRKDSNAPTKDNPRHPGRAKLPGKKKAKPRGLTDAQRAAWAHAHYIINHGTVEEASRFLTHPRTVERTPAEALHQIKVMARRRVPTWEQAAAAVFSSSDSSCESPAPHDRLSTNIIPRRSYASSDSSREPSGPSKRPTPDNVTQQTYDGCDNNNYSANTNPPSTITKCSPPPTPANATNDKMTPIKTRYKTRSKTAKTRKQAADAKTLSLKNLTPPTSAKKRQTRRKRGAPRPSMRPKRIRIAPSQIRGAGNGLYLMEDAEADEWIARYSGDPLTKAECDRRQKSHYRVQVHKNLFLDAADPKHFEGRNINDARFSKFKVNARFSAGYTTNICSTTGFYWVRIYATRKIKAGEEIFISYGDDFWAGMAPCSSPSKILQTTATTTTPEASLWAAPAPSPDNSITPTQEELWTAPAPLVTPSPTISTDHHKYDDLHTPTKTHSNTLIWPIQVPAPSSPTILGHSNPHRHPDQNSIRHTYFNTPLSPIPTGPSPNYNPYMNEIYTISQMYDMNETLLLPHNITNSNT